MLKRIFILFSCTGLCATEQSGNKKLSIGEVLIVVGVLGATGCGIGAAIAVYGPIVIPPVVASIKAAASTVAAKAVVAGGVLKVAAPTIATIGSGIFVARQIRPYVLPTKEEMRESLLRERSAEALKAKSELTNCLIKNKAKLEGDILHMPTICEEVAMMFETIAGQQAFNRLIREELKI